MIHRIESRDNSLLRQARAVRDGKIVQMDVWNDSAERLLTRNGIDA